MGRQATSIRTMEDECLNSGLEQSIDMVMRLQYTTCTNKLEPGKKTILIHNQETATEETDFSAESDF